MATYVTTDSGTGVVHSAPGHGHDDFITCRENGITDIINVLDDEGFALSDFGADFQGKNVLTNLNEAVIDALNKVDKLLSHLPYQHKYPYDWRAKTPLVIRCTKQWFIDLKEIQSLSISLLEDVNVVPPAGKNRLASFVRGREDWCISRQRS